MNESEARQLAAATGGAPFTIDVYCDDASHLDATWDVAFLVIDPVADPPQWGIYSASTRWRRGHGQQSIKAQADLRVVLRGDRRLTDDEIIPEVLADPEVRIRYQFPCQLCGKRLELRGERVHPVLDQMALGGMGRIRLARLGAIVDS